MFPRPVGESQGLQDAIDNLLSEMAGHDGDSDEYARMADQLVKLYSLKETPQRISPDTLATVIGNLLGIIFIVRYERIHVVTSKALSMILRTQKL